MPLWHRRQGGRLWVSRIRQFIKLGVLDTPASSPPAAPSGLTATMVSFQQIDLTWTDNATDETGFKVEQSPNGSTWTEVGTTGVGGTSYSATGLSPGATFYFRVRAYNGAGNSSYSNTASATTDTVTPDPPSNLQATVVSSTQIDLSWTDNSSDETGFRIDRSLDNSSWTQVGTVGSGVTTYSATGLSPDTLYYFRVRSYSGVGNSAPTSPVSATTLFVPSAVSGLRIDFNASSISGKVNADPISSWVEGVSGWNADQATTSKQPTYRTNVVGSKPVVRFDGNDELTLPAGALGLLNGKSGCSIFAVVSTAVVTVGTRTVFFIANNSTGARFRVFANATAGRLGAGGRRLDGDTLASTLFAGSISANTFYVVGAIHDPSTANLKAYNGDSEEYNGTLSTTGATYSATDSTVVRLGANQAGTGEYWNGDMARVLVYDRPVTASERAKIIDYLQAEYGL